MKAKTIKSILRKKTDEWISSIDDTGLQDVVYKNAFITGGAIASMLLKERPNDYDVYFKTKEAAVAVAQYYVDQFEPQRKEGIECKLWVESLADRVKVVIKSAGVASEDGTEKEYRYFEARPEGEAGEYIGEVMQDPADIQEAYEDLEQQALEVDDKTYRPVFMSTNAITLSDKMQLVLRFFGEPAQVHENYDFIHCTNYWQSWDSQLVLNQAALEALLSKELRYVGSKYPLASIIRLRKFIQRGWTVNAGQILKMVWQVSEMDLSDIDVLEDQLTGVDVAYFLELVDKLKEKDSQKVNAAYLVEIIDRMF